jgi:hypothetical protein
MMGVQVTVNSEHDRTVMPVLDGRHPAVSFGRRTVLSLQDFRSALNQQDAQTRWAAFQHQSLAPTLIDWCERYCVAFSGGGTLTSAREQSNDGLFSPSVEAGAQSYDALQTHHFRRSDPPVPLGQSRFIRKAETLMRDPDGNREVEALFSWNFASISSHSP